MKNDLWQTLAQRLRKTPSAFKAGVAPPLGFEARVLARVRGRRSNALELWQRMALRALAPAGVVLLVCWVLARPQPQVETVRVDASLLAELALTEAWNQ